MKIFAQTVAGIILFVVLAVGILTGIRNSNRQPSVILTSTECLPPCWYGIHPGKTSVWEAYEILNHLNGINMDSLMWETNNNGVLTGIDWFFQRPIEDAGGYIYFKENKVTAIEILTINSLRLSELFERLGSPEEYWTTLGYGKNREYLEVVLLYPAKGYVTNVLIDTETKINQVEIRERTPVFKVIYFDPKMFDELLHSRLLIEHPVESGTFQQWTGFGAISFERK